MSTPHAIIFDADGVVIEPWGFANVLEADYGISRDATHAFFRGPFQACLVGEADLRVCLEGVLGEWGWRGTVDELIEVWMQADDLPVQPVLDHVAAIRRSGRLCCLASNQEFTRARYITHRMGFADYFDHLFFSCDLGAMKPELAYYRQIEQAIGVEPAHILFLDDSPGHVQGAIDAGWQAIHFTGPEVLSQI